MSGNVAADSLTASQMVGAVRSGSTSAPWNVAGFPCASVPAGIGSDGVPLSVQVVAPSGGEALILSVAAQLEDLRPWQRFSVR
jgi:amidase